MAFFAAGGRGGTTTAFIAANRLSSNNGKSHKSFYQSSKVTGFTAMRSSQIRGLVSSRMFSTNNLSTGKSSSGPPAGAEVSDGSSPARVVDLLENNLLGRDLFEVGGVIERAPSLTPTSLEQHTAWVSTLSTLSLSSDDEGDEDEEDARAGREADDVGCRESEASLVEAIGTSRDSAHSISYSGCGEDSVAHTHGSSNRGGCGGGVGGDGEDEEDTNDDFDSPSRLDNCVVSPFKTGEDTVEVAVKTPPLSPNSSAPPPSSLAQLQGLSASLGSTPDDSTTCSEGSDDDPPLDDHGRHLSADDENRFHHDELSAARRERGWAGVQDDDGGDDDHSDVVDDDATRAGGDLLRASASHTPLADDDQVSENDKHKIGELFDEHGVFDEKQHRRKHGVKVPSSPPPSSSPPSLSKRKQKKLQAGARGEGAFEVQAAAGALPAVAGAVASGGAEDADGGEKFLTAAKQQRPYQSSTPPQGRCREKGNDDEEEGQSETRRSTDSETTNLTDTEEGADDEDDDSDDDNEGDSKSTPAPPPPPTSSSSSSSPHAPKSTNTCLGGGKEQGVEEGEGSDGGGWSSVVRVSSGKRRGRRQVVKQEQRQPQQQQPLAQPHNQQQAPSPAPPSPHSAKVVGHREGHGSKEASTPAAPANHPPTAAATATTTATWAAVAQPEPATATAAASRQDGDRRDRQDGVSERVSSNDNKNKNKNKTKSAESCNDPTAEKKQKPEDAGGDEARPTQSTNEEEEEADSSSSSSAQPPEMVYRCASVEEVSQLTADMEGMVQWVDRCHQDSSKARIENAKLLEQVCVHALTRQSRRGSKAGRSGGGDSDDCEDEGGEDGGEVGSGGHSPTLQLSAEGGGETTAEDPSPSSSEVGCADGAHREAATATATLGCTDTAAAAAAAVDGGSDSGGGGGSLSVSLKEYGSTAYGLALPDSDLDYVLVVTTNKRNRRQSSPSSVGQDSEREGDDGGGGDDDEDDDDESSASSNSSSGGSVDFSASSGGSSSSSVDGGGRKSGSGAGLGGSSTDSGGSGGGSGGATNGYQLSRAQQLEYLSLVAVQLETAAWVRNLTFIKTAQVPVLKYVGVGGLRVDLSCLGSSHQGLRTHGYLTQEVSARPALRSLVVVLKQLLRDHGLDDNARGGLSSFGLFVVVRCFLAWHEAMLAQMQMQMQMQNSFLAGGGGGGSGGGSAVGGDEGRVGLDRKQRGGRSRGSKGAHKNKQQALSRWGEEGGVAAASQEVGSWSGELAGAWSQGPPPSPGTPERKRQVGGVEQSPPPSSTTTTAAEAEAAVGGDEGGGGSEFVAAVEDGEKSVGWLLLAFLEQHATQLDYGCLAFTVQGYAPRMAAGLLEQQHGLGAAQLADFDSADPMVVVDPFDLVSGRNVARGLYRLSLLRGVLRNAHESLSQRGARLASLVNTRPPPLPPLSPASSLPPAASPL